MILCCFSFREKIYFDHYIIKVKIKRKKQVKKMTQENHMLPACLFSLFSIHKVKQNKSKKTDRIKTKN